MKTMIKENGITFKELEKNIYSWICQIGRQFTSEFLERYDQKLMKGTKADTDIRHSPDYGENSVWRSDIQQGGL